MKRLRSSFQKSYYYTRDHEGSIRELLDGSGNLLTRYNYDPYGKTTTTYISGTHDSTKQYAEMMVHPASGLYLTLYRLYDALRGIWRSRDPMGEAGGLNIYAYVGNNPSNMIDTFGLEGANIVVGTVFSGPGDQNYDAYFSSIPGHQVLVDPNKLGVSLPGHVVPKGYDPTASNICVLICSMTTHKCTKAPLVDIGPHHTDDDYWNQWGDVNSGIGQHPKAEGEKGNKAGIDMTPATAKALGFPVDYPPGKAPEMHSNKQYEFFYWRFVPCNSCQS